MIDILIRKFIKNAQNVENPAVRGQYGALAGIVGICCNLLLSTFKMTIGFFSGSISIAADGLNNLTDASANITTLVGFKISSKPADAEHPYGHARSEYISGMFVALMILLIGVELMKSSVEKIIKPTPVEFTLIAAVVLVFSILIKFWMSSFNRRIGKKIHSPALMATAQDSVNDVYTTSAVLLSAIIAQFTGLRLDGFMGAGVALFIFYSGFRMMKDTLSPLIGEAPNDELVSLVAAELLAEPKILGIHDLILHNYGPGRCFASAHAEVSAAEDVLECHDAIDNVERKVLSDYNIHLVIHYDPILVGDPFVDEITKLVHTAADSLFQGLSVHDVRVVKGPDHTNVIFDVVKPFSCKMSDESLIQQLAELLKQKDERLFAVITVDNDYAGVGERVSE